MTECDVKLITASVVILLLSIALGVATGIIRAQRKEINNLINSIIRKVTK